MLTGFARLLNYFYMPLLWCRQSLIALYDWYHTMMVFWAVVAKQIRTWSWWIEQRDDMTHSSSPHVGLIAALICPVSDTQYKGPRLRRHKLHKGNMKILERDCWVLLGKILLLALGIYSLGGCMYITLDWRWIRAFPIYSIFGVQSGVKRGAKFCWTNGGAILYIECTGYRPNRPTWA